jgi:hypothetical protein
MKSAERPPLRPISEQMKAWSSALASELERWPQITRKSFFGFTALYRGKKMFGLLPRTRGIFQNNAVAFRMDGGNRATRALLEKDERIAAFDKDKARWFTFQLSCDRDLHDALDYLAKAYEAARTAKKTR